MTFITRIPTEADLPELRDLIDAQESALDPKHKPASPSWPADLIEGFVDTPRNQVWCDSSGAIVAWASIQVDEHRTRLDIEMFRAPEFPAMAAVWDWCLQVAATDFPEWIVWPTINYLDHEMAEVLRATGFNLIRRYFLLTRPLDNDEYPGLPAGVTIDVMRTDDDYAQWHAAHQDSFSRHFAFSPRPAEQWLAINLDADAADPDGRFLLRVDGVVAGFVVCNNDNAHENGGYVDLLGVRHEFHHRGYGELLLRWAFAYSTSRGFTDIDLSVDTGNESGALALYERVGFGPMSEFQLFSRV